MPAEIDTGGPRVLHCDYRADCPIPIVGSTSIASECRSHCEYHQITATSLQPSYILRQAPGNDSRAVCSTKFLTTVSYRRRRLAATSNLRSTLRPPRRRASSESRTAELELFPQEQNATRTLDQYSLASGSFREESRVNESIDWTINDTVPRVRSVSVEYGFREEDTYSRSSNHSVEERTSLDAVETAYPPIGWSLLSSHRSRDPSINRNHEEVELPFGRSRVEQQTIRRTDSSSWRQQISQVDYQQKESQTLRDPSTTRKLRRACPKNRSYFQLALLLFLIAFGQSGLWKSGVYNHSVKASTTGLSVLAIGTVIGAVSAAPIDLMGDAGVRAERSANLSHITGASRKIQMYIKNRHLQILPDGTVNGSNDDTSDYTIFQRTSVSRGQLRIQGVATCLYLCMDSCGLLYGSREYTEDCVFNETLEQHNYNTYSSVRWSTAKKTLYLGLNRRGQPRRVQVKGHNLGRLSAYARVLTQVAPPDRVEALQRRMLGAQHNVRHRHNARGGQHHHRSDVIQQSLCPTLPAQEKDGRDRFRCRKRKKRKKRKRRCRPGEKPGPQCQIPEGLISNSENLTTTLGPFDEGVPSNDSSTESKGSCDGAATNEEACRHEITSIPSKTRKVQLEEASPDTTGRNATSNGKSKASRSSAKKVNVTGSMSQSKKPNLTDGKKRKRKGMPGRRVPPVQARKRFGSGTVNNRSAPDMATTAQPFTTSSSPWQSLGAATGPSAGRGASPRRRKLPTSPRNVFGHSSSPLSRTISPRRKGKTLFKTEESRVDCFTESDVRTATVPVTVPYQYSRESSTIVVPETSVFDRSDLNTATSDPSLSSETFTEQSETSSTDEESISTTSGEYLTSTVESNNGGSVGATSAPAIFRLLEEERSVEDVSDDGDENEEDSRFSTTERIESSTPHFPLERLAM